MRVVLNRIDERLIHGQILVSWVKRLTVQKIMIIDNSLANNRLLESVLQATLPETVSVDILKVEDAVNYIYEENDGFGKNVILLYKNPSVVYEMFLNGYRMPELNVGFMSVGPGRKKIAEFVYASREEIEIFKKLQKGGVDIYFQVVYAEKQTLFADIVDRLE